MQGELFPLGPESLVQLCRRLEARILAYAPELNRRDCTTLLGGLALVDLELEAIGAAIRQSPSWQARQALPSLAPPRAVSERIVIPPRRRWRSPRLPLTYTPLAHPAPSLAAVRPLEGWFWPEGERKAHFHLGQPRAFCGKLTVPGLIPEQLTAEPPTGDPAALCAVCAKMAARRQRELTGSTP